MHASARVVIAASCQECVGFLSHHGCPVPLRTDIITQLLCDWKCPRGGPTRFHPAVDLQSVGVIGDR